MDDKGIKQDIKNFYWDYCGRKTAIGVGCSGYGRKEFLRNIETDLSVLMKCYESGFRYFDTSRSYGDSELSVGKFISEIDRKTIFLATKSSVRQSGGVKFFKRNFYESFDRLNTDYIDLFQIHDSDSYDICMDEVIPFLSERKKEGMIRYIGFATRSLTAQSQAIVDGHIDSVLSYLDYNLIKTSALSVMELAKRYSVCFINASVLLFGLLKNDINEGRYKNSRGLAGKRSEFAKKMKDLCQSMGVDIIDAAIQYSLLNPDVDITLNGIKSLDNLESTINAIKQPLFPEQWAAVFDLQRTCENINIPDEFNY